MIKGVGIDVQEEGLAIVCPVVLFKISFKTNDMKLAEFTGATATSKTLMTSPTYEEESGFDVNGFFQNENKSHITPQHCGCESKSNCTCGNATTKQFIYVFGDVRPVLPSLSLQKEFYNDVVTDPEDKIRPFRDIAFKYLKKAENIYLARELNWVFQIKGFIDLYILKVTTNRALSNLIEAIAPRQDGDIDYDIIIAEKTTQIKKETATGSELPVINYAQLYNITFQTYAREIFTAIKNAGLDPKEEEVKSMLSDILQLTNNRGDEDRYRALNFLILRYMDLYVRTYRMRYVKKDEDDNDKDLYDLVRVNTDPPEMYGTRKIFQVIFTYQSLESSAVQNFSCSVDTSEEFPYLVLPLAKYYPGI